MQGLEDCLVLDELVTQHGEDWDKVLPAFSQKRNKDAEAIVDLAMYHYIEVSYIKEMFIFFILAPATLHKGPGHSNYDDGDKENDTSDALNKYDLSRELHRKL